MLSIGTVVMGVADIHRAAEFWRSALGYVPRQGPMSEDFVILVPEAGAGTRLALDQTESPPDDEPHVHLDLYTDDAQEQQREVERLVSLGAQRVDWPHYPDDPDFVVLADTEGNRFCVIDTSHV